MNSDDINHPIFTQIIKSVSDCYQHAQTSLNRQFPQPEINFKLRGKNAGCAHLQQNLLRFNPILLKENQQAFIQEVVPHEVCHLLCFQLYGKVRPHGKEWQQMMQYLFNLEPKTKHQFSLSSLPSKRFNYYCNCGDIELSITRHNKVLRGKAQYSCRRCHQQLIYKNTFQQQK